MYKKIMALSVMMLSCGWLQLAAMDNNKLGIPFLLNKQENSAVETKNNAPVQVDTTPGSIVELIQEIICAPKKKRRPPRVLQPKKESFTIVCKVGTCKLSARYKNNLFANLRRHMWNHGFRGDENLQEAYYESYANRQCELCGQQFEEPEKNKPLDKTIKNHFFSACKYTQSKEDEYLGHYFTSFADPNEAYAHYFNENCNEPLSKTKSQKLE